MAGEVVQPTGTSVATSPGAMRAPVANPFDYGSLDTEQADAARSAAQRIKARTAAAILDTGRDLAAIRAMLDHGRFGRWVRAELGMTPRSAQNYLRAAALVDAKSETVSHLPPSTIYEIARSPAAAQARLLDRLANGEIGAGQVRSALRAIARHLRATSTAEPKAADQPQMDGVGTSPTEPSADLAAQLAPIVTTAVHRLGDLAATILEATKAGPSSDDRWSAFCCLLRVALQQRIAEGPRPGLERSWQDMRDTALLSSKITQRQRMFLAMLGDRGEPREEQRAKLNHIVRVTS